MPQTVLLGLDDTDLIDTPGTNHLARHLVRQFGDGAAASRVSRHQLLVDPRIPCTRKNGCVAVHLATRWKPAELIAAIRRLMLEWCPAGSDPGLCVATNVPPEATAFGRRCQMEVVTQVEARDLAARHGLHLEGLGGTEGGVIGALAAIGLQATENDGRVVHLGAADEEPFEISGLQSVAEIQARGVFEVRHFADGRESDAVLEAGMVVLEKRLRPCLRGGRAVLFVEPDGAGQRVGAPEAERVGAPEAERVGAPEAERDGAAVRWRAVRVV